MVNKNIQFKRGLYVAVGLSGLALALNYVGILDLPRYPGLFVAAVVAVASLYVLLLDGNK